MFHPQDLDPPPSPTRGRTHTQSDAWTGTTLQMTPEKPSKQAKARDRAHKRAHDSYSRSRSLGQNRGKTHTQAKARGRAHKRARDSTSRSISPGQSLKWQNPPNDARKTLKCNQSQRKCAQACFILKLEIPEPKPRQDSHSKRYIVWQNPTNDASKTTQVHFWVHKTLPKIGETLHA